ncbi:transposase [Nocardia panacis]|uniref:transposase n=1 Tax=Nocardia panacis TaxID=2340916 RepID=UPI00131596C7
MLIVVWWDRKEWLVVARKYANEFKEQAICVYRESNPRPTIADLAGRFGVPRETLRGWIRHAEIGVSERTDRSARMLSGTYVMRMRVAELKCSDENCILQVSISLRR